MKCLTEHPYFEKVDQVQSTKLYHFKYEGKRNILRIYDDKRLVIGYHSFDASVILNAQQWFRELYSQALKELIELKKTKLLLSGEDFEKFELAESYVKSESVRLGVDEKDEQLIQSSLLKIGDLYDIHMEPKVYFRWKDYKAGGEYLETLNRP